MKRIPYNHVLTAATLTRRGKLAEATELLLGGLKRTDTVTRLADIVANDASQAASGESKGDFLTRSFTCAAGTRTYKLYVPSGYRGQACALIVMLHGCTQSPDDFAAGTRMNQFAEDAHFLVAYPEQPASSNASKCWNWFDPRHQQRDRGEPSIIAGITREIAREYTVDPARIYVAGMSAGGAAAAVQGAVYPEIYAAVGVHSGVAYGLARDLRSAFAVMKGGEATRTVTSRRRSQPANSRPVPTIVFHGDRDVTVHPRNADRFSGGTDVANCTRATESGQAAGGRKYTKSTHRDANGNLILEQWTIHDAGHAWSGGSPDGSYTEPGGPNASQEMVRFFLGTARS